MRFYRIMALLFCGFFATGAEILQRTEEDHVFDPPPRVKVNPECRFFSERQPYLPFQNFMHFWIDRPLYTDVSLRRTANPKKEGFLKDLEILRQYGLDGFASIDYFGVHEEQLQFLKEAGVRDYQQMYVLTDAPYPVLLQHVKTILKSPYTYRVNGRPVFWKYGGVKPISNLAVKLKKDIGEDVIIFCDLPLNEIYGAFNKSRDGKVSAEVVERLKQDTQKILDQCGGLVLWNGEFSTDWQGEYGMKKVRSPLYRNYLLPAVLELMKLERNRGKMLGITTYQGYVNHLNGPLHNEDGTRMLRVGLEEGILCNPDIILLFEWNEANENTSFQPTVANGRALERIVNYYKQRLNGQPFTPRLGDDPSCPNLILSFRQTVLLGEKLHYELLNIPDTSENKTFKARLVLKDAKGKTRFTFPEETFSANRFRAISYRLPSENFSSADVLTTEMEITGSDGTKKILRGFDHTRLSPTTCVNYKYTRQPLREILHPDAVDFHVVRNPDGSFRCQGSVKAEEPLASVEVLDRGDEVYSFDRENEFDRNRYALFRGKFTTQLRSVTLSGDITVSNSKDWKIRSAQNAWECFRDGLRFGNTEKVNTFFEGRGTFLLAVPKEDVAKAVLTVDYDKIGKVQVALADLERTGKFAKIMNNQVRLELERMDNLPDYPVHADSKNVSFSVSLRSPNREPVFQLRAVTVGGKVFRSFPALPAERGTKQIQTTVYSETLHKPVPLELPAETLPELRYGFDPQYGDWLTNGFEPRWDISMGGGWYYASPAWTNRQKFMPENYSSVAPVWKKADDRWCLDFDGKGAYLVLPQESIPRGAPFRVEFEVKFLSGGNQVLIRPAAGEYRGSLGLFLENRKLKGVYYGMGSTPRVFQTALEVPVGKWCRIAVSKDFEFITFEVDGKKESFAYDRRGILFQHFTFGGDLGSGVGLPDHAGTFHGLLRKLEILHHL